MAQPIYHSQYTAAQIENSIGKTPIIDSTTHEWKVWDITTGQYVGTGIIAESEEYAAAAEQYAEDAASAVIQARDYSYAAGNSSTSAASSASAASSSATDAAASATAAASSATAAAASAQAAEVDVEGVRTQAFAAFPRDSVSGSPASFPDGADDIPVIDLKVNIEPVQTGSGDPSPDNVRPISGWTGANVTRAGKNLLEITAATTTSKGITFTVNKDAAGNVISISVNGTATGEATFRVSTLNLVSFPAGTYKVSGCPQGGDSQSYRLRGSGGLGGDIGSGFTYTVPNSITSSYVEIVIAAGYTANNLVFQPMITLSSVTDRTFEPYVGDIYSISWQSEVGTVYGGTLDVTTGVLTVTHAFESKTWGEMDEDAIYTNNERRMFNFAIPGDTKNRDDSGSNIAVFVDDRTDTIHYQIFQTGLGVYFFLPHGTEDNTVVQIFYRLATPTTYQLTPIEVRTLLGVNNIWADCGPVEVEYRADTTAFVNKKVEALLALMSEI